MSDPEDRLPDDTQGYAFPPEAIEAFEKAAAKGGTFTLTARPPCEHDTCHVTPAEAEELAWHVYGFACAVLRAQWDRDGKPPRRLEIKVEVTASAD